MDWLRQNQTLVLLLLLLAALYFLPPKGKKTGAPAGPTNTGPFFGLLNASVIINPLWWAVVIFGLIRLCEHYAGFSFGLKAEVIWSAGFAAILGYMSRHTTPVQHKSILLVLGKRLRAGPDKHGYTEGLNIPLLPVPLSTLQNIPTPEFRVEFKNPVSYSKENAEVRTEGYAIFETVDAYLAPGIVDLEGTAQEMSSKVVRETTDEFNVEPLMQAAERDRFSRMVMDRIRVKIAEGGDDGDSYVRCLRLKKAEITHVDFDKNIKHAYSQKVAEPIEAALEMDQLGNRLKQVDAYVEKGVKPDTALAASLVDAGKVGAHVTSVSIRGLGKVGEKFAEGAAKLAEGISNLARGKGP